MRIQRCGDLGVIPIICGTADESKSGSVETTEPLGKTLYLGALFGGWYAFNILFNM